MIQPITANTPEPGIYYNVPFDEYLAWPAFSKSRAMAILNSGAHFEAYDRRNWNKPNIRIGKISDCMLTEKDAVKNRYAITPKTYEAADGTIKPWRGGTNAAKAFEADAALKGLASTDRKEVATCEASVASVRAHREAGKIFESGEGQVSIVWIDPPTGILCKGRPDWITDDYIVEFKTAREGKMHPSAWPRYVWDMGYDIQTIYVKGWELAGGDPKKFVFVGVETADPYAVGVYYPRTATLDVGEARWSKAVEKFKQYKSGQVVTAYPQFPEPFDIPEWAIRSVLGSGLEIGSNENDTGI